MALDPKEHLVGSPVFSYSPFHGFRWNKSAAYLLGGSLRRLGERETLISAGDPLTHLFYLESGELNVFVGSPGGTTKIIQVLEPGSEYGDLAVVTGMLTAPATVVAAKPSLVRATPVGRLLERLRVDPELACEMMASMGYKALSFLKQVEDLAFRGVRKRIACLLYALFSRSDDNSVSLSLTQETIAELVAAHRVTVTLALGELQEMGIIAVGRERVFLLDGPALLREALDTDR